jgi:2-iminobutanoate/2-iminopropanoate deaminase
MFNIESITPNNFTKTIGAYSHGIKVTLDNCEMLYVTGQIAMDSKGNVISPNEPDKQAEFIFNNIDKILTEAGFSMDNVIKAQIFLTNINDFSKVSEIRNKYFKNSKPVSTLVEVSSLVKKDCCIEIEVTAIKEK